MKKHRLWSVLHGALAFAAACGGTEASPPSAGPPTPPLAAGPSGNGPPSPALASRAYLTSLSFSPGQIVAVGHRSEGDALCPMTLVSSDGFSWAREERECGEGGLWSVTHTDAGFFAVGGVLAITTSGTVRKPLLLRSADGHAWARTTFDDPGPLNSIAANGNELVLTTLDSVYRASGDLAWDKQTLPARGNVTPRVDHVTSALGKFFVYADDSAYQSANGTSWEQVRFGELATYSERGTYPFRLSFANGTLFASIVEDCCFGESPENIRRWMARSADGTTWQTQQAQLLTSVTYGKGRYVAASGGQLLDSKDGVAWTATASRGEITAVVFAMDAFFATADGAILRSEDGQSWTVVYAGPPAP